MIVLKTEFLSELEQMAITEQMISLISLVLCHEMQSRLRILARVRYGITSG